jgi:lysophospholipase L1-like esterase
MRRVLIIGDSQSQGIGVALQKILKAQGDQVTRISRAGYGTAKLLTTAKQTVTPASYDVIFVFVGGNNTWSPSASTPLKASLTPVNEMLDFLAPAGAVVWIGPPPATEIANLPLARKVFGTKVNDRSYWFTTGTARRREEKNNLYRSAVRGGNAQYFDVRSVLSPFPPQGDGIHVTGKSAQQVAQVLSTYPRATTGPSLLVAGVGAAALVVFLGLRGFKK